MVGFVERMSEDRNWRDGRTGPAGEPIAAPPGPPGCAGVAPAAESSGTPDAGPGGNPGAEPKADPTGFPTLFSAGIVPKARRMAILSQVVTREILPRLAFTRQGKAAAGEEDRTARPTTMVDTGELVRLLLDSDAAAGVLFIEAQLARGIAVETLYTGLLPDAARWLGLMWEEDRCDFAQVTVGVGRLQQAVRFLAPKFHAASVNRADECSLLLMPAPGEHHSLGLQILAEFFQRAGWRVDGGPLSAGVDAADLVRRNWFDVAGFSVGSEKTFEGLAQTIRRVRRASRNRSLGVMVGGPLFQQRPELIALSGADASAADAPAAVMIARDLARLRVAAE